jgi:hypothetical protein
MPAEQRTTPRNADPTRKVCYDRIREAFLAELKAYYQAHPDWYLDPRSRAKIEMMNRIRLKVFGVLNGFAICEKTPEQSDAEACQDKT